MGGIAAIVRAETFLVSACVSFGRRRRKKKEKKENKVVPPNLFTEITLGKMLRSAVASAARRFPHQTATRFSAQTRGPVPVLLRADMSYDALGERELAESLATLENWGVEIQGDDGRTALTKSFEFENFVGAWRFMSTVALQVSFFVSLFVVLFAPSPH